MVPAAALFEAAGFGLLIPVMHGILSPGGLSTEGKTSSLVSFFGGTAWFSTPRGLGLFILVILAAITARLICQYLQVVITILETSRLETNLRTRIFERFLGLGFSYFDREPAGKLGTFLNQVSSAVPQGIHLGRTAFTSLFMGLSYVAILFFLSWPLALLTAVFLLAAAGLARWTAGLVHASSRQALDEGLKQRARSFDLLMNMKLIKSFGTEERERKRFEKKEREHEKQFNRTMILTRLMDPLQQWLVTVSMASFLIVTLWWVPAKNPGSLVTLLLSLLLWQRGTHVIMQLASCHTQFMSLAPSFVRLAELLGPSPEPRIENRGTPFQGLKNSLVFQNVWMAYDGKPILRDVSFTLSKGEILAITGPSGAGKTTLVELILRFYEFQKGEIRLDGVDLRRFDPGSLRKKIGLVSQETLVLNDTIYNNIAYGRPGASWAGVEGAAQKACLHERILTLPDGYETVIGDKGAILSGGELQRLAIARVFLKNPEILILDEATNHLDLAAEEAVQKDLIRLAAGRTVIVIAHRFSAIERAHRILFLEEGRILQDPKTPSPPKRAGQGGGKT